MTNLGSSLQAPNAADPMQLPYGDDGCAEVFLAQPQRNVDAVPRGCSFTALCIKLSVSGSLSSSGPHATGTWYPCPDVPHQPELFQSWSNTSFY